ncbi:DUF6415 family natural product biosynthesis protein [Streptomyces himalayensis]|uniref:Restriction endonuclease n=1 Tax=Streptomyces himalayensis subsp. himalayensis TaxID=2756131 RepID=A0A7W0DW00_9ACTN|nr:DUF6415 family natural product biosynthesis protein [Streptomyces himalayensis]MBA2951763.1 restriction endonuclease [Streptomyces himalayensis subsp. himalayensis]
MTTHQPLYDPEGHLDAELLLDREPHMVLVKAVLAWTNPGDALQPRDCEQIALQLTGHARAVAADVRRRCEQLPSDSEMRALTEVVLAEASRRLSTPIQATVASAQNRARLVRALYERLDRLQAANPATPAAS